MLKNLQKLLAKEDESRPLLRMSNPEILKQKEDKNSGKRKHSSQEIPATIQSAANKEVFTLIMMEVFPEDLPA